MEGLYADNNHHLCEACFKGLARALRQAVEIDPRRSDAVPSTKGCWEARYDPDARQQAGESGDDRMMRVYTVHVRTPAERLDRDIHLVKEGFSWPAFFFSAVWALWVRLWLVAVVLIALDILWTFGGAWLGLPLLSTTAVSLPWPRSSVSSPTT